MDLTLLALTAVNDANRIHLNKTHVCQVLKLKVINFCFFAEAFLFYCYYHNFFGQLLQLLLLLSFADLIIFHTC